MARWMIVLGLLLLAVSCEPFLFSNFPGYVADATAVADLSGTFAGADMEHYDFFVLNNGANEFAFLVATSYDGAKNLYIYTSDLSTMFHFNASESGSQFGARHFVSAAGEFVVGDYYFKTADISSAAMPSTIPGSAYGPDTGGCALFTSGSPSPSPVNALFQIDGSGLSYSTYNSGWGSQTSSTVSLVLTGNSDFRLLYAGHIVNVTISNPTPVPASVSVLAFRNDSEWPEQGSAVIFVDNAYMDFSSPTPLLTESRPGRLLFPLGGVRDEENSVFATVDGLVVRNADSTMRLIGWDGQVKAATRDNGASGWVLIDFSPVDYYYVFDPLSLKLYKARDWWQTN